jgi:imidazolonepropionase-like amidohydrolase
MIVRASLWALILLVAVSSVSEAANAPRDLAITDITVVDVIGGREVPHRTVLLRGDRIVAVGPSSSAPRSSVRRIDGRGKWLIPGLWDMHMHALTDRRYTYFFPLLIAHGVVSIREMGSNLPPAEIKQIRRDVDSGKLLGPHFAEATFRLLDGPGTKFRTAVELATPEQGRAAVREFRSEGSDFAKPYNLLARDTYLAIVDQARRLGQPVEGHIPFSISAIEAARVGQRSFEHNFGVLISLSRDETALRRTLISGGDSWGHIEARAASSLDEGKAQRLFAEMRRRAVWSCPTISLWRRPMLIGRSDLIRDEPRYRYIPPWMWRDWSRTLDNVMRKNLTLPELRATHFAMLQRLIGKMRRAGIPLLAGTDSGAATAVAGFALHDELVELVQAGLTPIDALRSATILPARFSHQERVAGSVTIGKRADLVLLDADPLADIHNSRHIVSVVRAGRLFDRKALNDLLDRAREAALAAPKPKDIPDD